MKQHPCITQRRVLRRVLSAATLAILAFSGGALAIDQSGEAKNMHRVGHTDLQGRPSYQPNVIQYPDGRTIAFAGTHNNIPVTVPGYTFLPNPLNIAPSTARSRSASGMTTSGFFPPSSNVADCR